METPAKPRSTVVRDFLNVNNPTPVTGLEFVEFWKACTEPEQNQFAVEAVSLTAAA